VAPMSPASPSPRRRRGARAALIALPLCAALVAACASTKATTTTNSGGTRVSTSTSTSTTSTSTTSKATTTTAKATTTTTVQDLDMSASDFVNLKDMTAVRGFFIANRLGHLQEALAVADNPKGGVYPVGTIIQLIPTEAMVKRRAGFDPATHDWEFFSLNVSASGTTIVSRGGQQVINRFGGSCANCHSQAAPQFDSVCEHDHGCAPLPVSDAVIKGVQQADPRP
jgi:hypothetical protein